VCCGVDLAADQAFGNGEGGFGEAGTELVDVDAFSLVELGFRLFKSRNGIAGAFL